jgi:hypothetical protein
MRRGVRWRGGGGGGGRVEPEARGGSRAQCRRHTNLHKRRGSSDRREGSEQPRCLSLSLFSPHSAAVPCSTAAPRRSTC